MNMNVGYEDGEICFKKEKVSAFLKLLLINIALKVHNIW